MWATTLAVPLAGMLTVSGSKVTVQPLGGVALIFAFETSAVPVFDTTSDRSVLEPADAFVLSTPLPVVIDRLYEPVISTERSAWAVSAPALASTVIGYVFAAASVEGL